MRNLAIISLIILLFAACSNTEESVSSVSISGIITNAKSPVITFRKGDISEIDSLSETGSFEVTFELEEAGEIRFSHGGEYGSLYARPGDAITMTLDTDQFDETLTFTGDAAGINKYLTSMVLLDDSLMGYRDLMILEEMEFIAAQDSLEELKLSYLANVQDEDFKTYIKEYNFWNKYAQRLNYEMNHEYYLGLPLEDFKVSEGFNEFRTDLNINDSTKLKYPAFKSYVNSLVFSTSRDISSRDSLDTHEAYLIAVDSLIIMAPVKEYLYYSFLHNYYTRLPAGFAKDMTDSWIKLKPEASRVEKIQEISEKWSKLTEGMPAPDFAYESINGDTLTMADFIGSVVYIDVWATWCGPCIGEHPSMEKLQEKFKDENVTFVAVSIDDTKEPWIEMVNEKELGGVHLFAPGAWNSSIAEDYMIDGIPRFILIDQEGKIVSANAARPSGNIDEEIDKLLNPS